MVLHQAAGELRAQVWEWSRAPFEVLGLYLGLYFVEKVSYFLVAEKLGSDKSILGLYF